MNISNKDLLQRGEGGRGEGGGGKERGEGLWEQGCLYCLNFQNSLMPVILQEYKVKKKIRLAVTRTPYISFGTLTYLCILMD